MIVEISDQCRKMENIRSYCSSSSSQTAPIPMSRYLCALGSTRSSVLKFRLAVDKMDRFLGSLNMLEKSISKPAFEGLGHEYIWLYQYSINGITGTPTNYLIVLRHQNSHSAKANGLNLAPSKCRALLF